MKVDRSSRSEAFARHGLEPRIETDGPERIPASRLVTTGLSGRERFDAWRNSVATIFSCEPRDPEEIDRFDAEVTAFDLGSVLFAESRASGQRFSRNNRLIRATGLDHLMIQWYRRGGYQGMHAGDGVSVEAGQVGVLDLGREFETQIDGDHFQNCSVFLPRNLVLPRLRSRRSLHSLRLSVDSALGRILTKWLDTTAEELPRATLAEAPAITQSILATMTVLLDSVDADGDPSASLDKPAGNAMRDYIERNLLDPDLDVESICATFRCSRAYVYQLFREHHGVARYIQERRLVGVYKDLTSPASLQQSVSALAHKWGFSSHSHLCRRFRERFEMSPGDARELAFAGGVDARMVCDAAEADSHVPAYHDWLARLADLRDG